MLKGRINIYRKLKAADLRDSKIAWFHAASLGEFEQGRPVIEEFRKENPDYKILLTFFSPSGFEIRKNYTGAEYIFYLPLDFTWNAWLFIKLANPKIVFFVKYEFWHNYLKILESRKIPTYCFSANFRENQAFFKWYGGWYRKLLHKFTHIFVQNERSLKLLHSIGFHNVSIAGDTRFDRVAYIASQAKTLPIVEDFACNANIVVAGSSWPADEELLIDFINQPGHNWKYIIAPHEIGESHIQGLLDGLKKKTVRFSQYKMVESSTCEVLIIDNVGMLSSVYKYGKIAYIGGGFGKGIHNILEAATYGIPVIFGPKYKKFQEAIELKNRGGAFAIHNAHELKHTLTTLITNDTARDNAGKISKEFVKESIGATQKILEVAMKG